MLVNSSRICYCLNRILVSQRSLSSTAPVVPVLQRSFMYVPGDKMAKIDKIAATKGSAAPDMTVLDLEDGVGYANKSVALDNILATLSSSKFDSSRTQLAVRINSLDSGLADRDLTALIKISSRLPQMINFPKVDSKDHIDWLSSCLKEWLPAGSPPLLLTMMIESAKAVVELRDLCLYATRPRLPFKLQGIVFGSDDYCASIGVQRSQANSEVLYARQKVVTVAKALGISSIDMVDIDLKNTAHVETNCQFGAQLGFSGKQVIHPAQLDFVHRIFLPSSARIDWARQLLVEFDRQSSAESGGQGVFIFKGQMIDMPSVLQARSIKAMADHVDKINLV